MNLHGLPLVATLAASLFLAGCASTPESAPTMSTTPTASATAAADEDCVICNPDGNVPSEGAEAPAAAEPTNCASLVGAPSSEVLSSDHKPTCAVVPGSSGILYGTTVCVGSNEPVYFWTATEDDDPDHSIYKVFAIRDGGTLGTVDDAAELYRALGGIAGFNYMRAAGCPGMASS